MNHFADILSFACGWNFEWFVVFNPLFDSPFRCDNRAVISTAKIASNFSVGRSGEFARDIHGEGSGGANGFASRFRSEISDGDSKHIADDFFDICDSHQSPAFSFEVAEDFSSSTERDFFSAKLVVALQAVNGSLDFSNVFPAFFRDVVECFFCEAIGVGQGQ